MSDFRKVTEQVSVSPQISTADIDTAIADGFTLIINNRPDGEDDGQPTNESLASYAQEKGLAWAYIPIAGGNLTLEAIESTSFALRDNEKVLAFCRSGTRSCNLWGLASAFTASEDPTDIITKAGAAGYDLTGLAPTLQHLHSSAG